jgi:hypothetical protein
MIQQTRYLLPLMLFVFASMSCNKAQQSEPSRLSPPLPSVAKNQLRAVADFAVFKDQKERSRALFLEASRVLLHPRCANCHPDGDVPAQGMQMISHQPPVTRGPESRGVVGMECAGCHQDHNLALARVPGAPEWHLAPREMAWVGKTPRYICQQMKDPKRNGGRSLGPNSGAQCARQARRLGMVPRRRSRTRTRNSGAVRRHHRRVDSVRG